MSSPSPFSTALQARAGSECADQIEESIPAKRCHCLRGAAFAFRVSKSAGLRLRCCCFAPAFTLSAARHKIWFFMVYQQPFPFATSVAYLKHCCNMKCCVVQQLLGCAGGYPAILFVFLIFLFCNTCCVELPYSVTSCNSRLFPPVSLICSFLTGAVAGHCQLFSFCPVKNGIRVAQQLCNLLIVRLINRVSKAQHKA